MTRVAITGNKLLLVPTTLFVGGNDTTHELANLANIFGITAEISGSQFRMGWFTDLETIPLSIVKKWVDEGAEVWNYPIWFKIDDITRTCPFSPAGQTDPVTGEPIPRETWETWGTISGRHAPVKYGDFWYRSNAEGASGQRLKASKWVSGLTSPPTGISIITVAQFKQVQEDNQEPI